MQKFIRTCLSLDEETRKQITELTEISGTTNSDVVKEAVKYFYRYIRSVLRCSTKSHCNFKL